MSSTEYRVGLDGNRNSSKVLKPPGGGSSDIFGLGPVKMDTQDKLCGKDAENSPVENKGVEVAKVPAKTRVRRNPITGEGIEFEPDNREKGANENDDLSEKADSEKATEVPTAEVPKVVPTSIRVRHPPGGKSSGIF